MKKLLLILIFVIFLIGCNLFQKDITEEQINKLQQELNENNLMLLNSRIADYSPEFQKVRITHNPLQLFRMERIFLYNDCSEMVDGGNFEGFEKYIKEKYDIRKKYNYTSYLDFLFDIKYVIGYYTFICINGYDVFLSDIENAFNEMKNNNFKFVDKQNIIRFKEVYPEAEDFGFFNIGSLLNEKEIGLYNEEASRRNRFYVGYWEKKPRDVNLLFKVLNELNVNSLDEAKEIPKHIQEEIEIIESNKPEDIIKKIEVNKQQVKELKPKTYDFPEIRMNKEDLIIIFNSNSLSQKALKDFNRIGLKTEDKSLTFIINNGKVIEIKDGITLETDFTVKTTNDNMVNLFNKGMNGDVKAIVSGIRGLNIPFTIKLKILKSLVI